MQTKHIVLFSGGVSSYLTAKRVKEKYGTDNLILLFTDTLIEDRDLYRFLYEAKDKIGGEFVHWKEGHTPWELFFKHHMIANSRVDICSKTLKRDQTRIFLKERFIFTWQYVLYLGLSWEEQDRIDKVKKNWKPSITEFPLADPPYLFKDDMFKEVETDGLKVPYLYELGFSHNNCGGFCVKAGVGHFKLLLEKLPDVYAEHEQKEQDFRRKFKKDVAILYRTVDGVK